MRLLYNFFVKKQETEEVKTQNEDGTFTLKEEKKDVPVEVFLKKLSSRDLEDMKIFESIYFSKLQTQGIATKLMILNSYNNAGGVVSEKEIKDWQEDVNKANKIRNEVLLKKTKKEETKELEEEYESILATLRDREIIHESIFHKSAENLAEQELLLWLTLNFTFFKEGEKFVPVFRGEKFSDKKDFYYDICDDESDVYDLEKKVFTKAYGFWHIWNRGVTTTEQFKEYEELIHAESDSSESLS